MNSPSAAAVEDAAQLPPDVSKGKVLIVDDEEMVSRALKRYLISVGFEVVTVADSVEGLAAALEPSFDVAVFDIRMPNLSGLDLLRAVKHRNPDLEVIIMTADSSAKTAVEAVRGGAYDYLTKPFASLDGVALVVGRAVERRRLVVQNRTLQLAAQSQQSEGGNGGMVGQSPAVQAIFRLVGSVAASQATVLITGESGTGKELVAKAIHDRSRRRDKPFLAVNCSALAENLLESELFGHEKGSFTGALKDTKGVFEAADGGTLFLDEIGDMPLSTQVRVLRAVQQGEIKPVGASQVIRVDVRIVAATNMDLRRAIAEGTFREDLFYRLNVIPIPIPPLRERGEDIALLAYHFLRKHGARNGKGGIRIEPEALGMLSGYSWPGNVRELENLIERLVVLCPGEAITPGDLPAEFGGRGVPRVVDQTSLAHLPFAQAKALAMRAFERRYLAAVLERNGGVITAAARAASLDRSNFRRLLKLAGVAAGGDLDEGEESPPLEAEPAANEGGPPKEAE